MERVSRRSLLATASATAAVAGVAAVAGPATAAQAAPAAAAPQAKPLSEHVVARVKDLRTGDVDLFIGQQQVTVRNPQLANAIAHAAQQHTT